MQSFEQSYCAVAALPNSLHKSYHDTIYGFPAKNDNELFKRLILEINQAGLSWSTIVKKEEGLITAYDHFDIKTVANYTEEDRRRLLSDPRIIRNKLKVNAAIYNAQQILNLQSEFGSFKNWLDHQFPKSREEWVKLFKRTFKFTGGEITNEFVMGTGYLKGAHHEDCPIYQKVIYAKPKWSEIKD